MFFEVLRTYKKCVKGKNKSPEVEVFKKRLGLELVKLTKELESWTYKTGIHRSFVVKEPKMREIWASPFRDRIIHHLVVEPLENIWEPRFHPKSFACRKGKGVYKAIEDFQNQVRRISQGGRKPVYALQIDVESFFFTINREILKNLMLKEAKTKQLKFLIDLQFKTDPRDYFKKSGDLSLYAELPARKSWHSRPKTQGIPIGNLTSQFGANLYLNELDHYISRKLKPKGFLRYMDDLTLLDSDPEALRPMVEQVDHWLKVNRKQNLNQAKTKLSPLYKGIDYLGFRLQQVNSAQEPLLVRCTPKKKWKLISEMKNLSKENWTPQFDVHILSRPHRKFKRQKLQKINSRLGLTTHARCYQFRKKSVIRLIYENSSYDITAHATESYIKQVKALKSTKNYTSMKINF